MDKIVCFDCGKDTYVEVVKDYHAKLPNNESLIVPKVPLLCCDHCGEIAVPSESALQIEAFIKEHRKPQASSLDVVLKEEMDERSRDIVVDGKFIGFYQWHDTPLLELHNDLPIQVLKVSVLNKILQLGAEERQKWQARTKK